jgi:hypothetical protein
VARLISDDVWRCLDPNAGRLTMATRRGMWRVMGAAALLAVVSTLLVWSGVVVPRLAVPVDEGLEYGGGPTVAPFFVFTIENVGWTPVTIVTAGGGGPGLALTDVRGPFPVTLEPGDRVRFTLVYRVADCTRPSAEPNTVAVRVRRWWGEQATRVAVPDTMIGWPHVLADLVCHPTP